MNNIYFNMTLRYSADRAILVKTGH